MSSGAPLVFDDTAIPAVPMPDGIVESQPVGWDHVTVWPDGRTLTVYFRNGAEACFGLDRVELTDVDGTLSIMLWTGFRADAAAVRCVAMEQLYSTVVTLEAPILGGGIPGADGVQHGEGTSRLIEPGASLMAMEPQPWERVTVGPDGRSLLVRFLGGTEDCYGLGSVDTPVTNGLQLVVIYYGMLAGLPEGTVCVLIGVYLSTPVTLPEPLLMGGLA